LPTAVPPPPLALESGLALEVGRGRGPIPLVFGAEAGRASCITLSAFWNESLASLSRTRSWGRFGPAMLGSTVERSSSRGVGGTRLRAPRASGTIPGPSHSLRTSRINSGGRPERLEIAEGLGVDREDPAGRPVFGGHVGDGRPVGQGGGWPDHRRRTRRNLPTTPLRRRMLGQRSGRGSVAVAPLAERAEEL